MYSKLTRHFTVTLICLLFCLFADGQTVSIVGSIKGVGGKDAVSYNEKKYGLTGSTLLYEISVKGLSDDVTVKSYSYKLNNEKEEEVKVTNGVIEDITIDGSSTSSPGEYKMTVKVTLSTGATIEKTNNEIVICSNVWSASKDKGWTAENAKKVVWDTDQNTLSVSASTNDSICSIGYKWVRGSTSLGEENTWKGALGIDNVVSSDVTVKCLVSFYAPNGETVWDSKEFTQVFTVYKSLTEDNIDFKAYYGEKEESKNGGLYLWKGMSSEDREYRNIKVTLKDPFNSVNASIAGIQWKINGKVDDSKKTFICNPEPYVDAIDGNGSHTDKYSVSFSYQPHESLKAKQLDYKKNVVEVITYNKPDFTLLPVINNTVTIDNNDTVTIDNNDTVVVWADTKIGINCEPKGGNSGEWSYSWTEGSNKQISKNYTAKTYAVDKTLNRKNYKLSLAIENKDPNGKLMFKETRVFTIDSWRKPTNKNDELVRRHLGGDADYDFKDTIYLYAGYDESVYGKRYFEIPDLGLDDVRWSYTWHVDGKETDKGIKIFNPVKKVQKDCSVEAKSEYKPKNLLAGLPAFSESKKLQVKFYGTPSVSIKEWKQGNGYSGKKIAVWETTINEVNVDTDGGNSWEYEWKIDGDALGSLSDDQKKWSDKLVVKTGSEISSDYKMSLKLTNKDPNGNIWFLQNAGATYTVYKDPHPYIVEEGKGNKIEIIPYKDSSLTVIKVYKGYERKVLLADSTALIDKSQYKWNNKWYYNDIVGDDKGIRSTPKTQKDLGFHDRDTLESLVALLCQPDNMSNEVAYRDTLHFITIFWPTPSYQLITNKKINNEGYLQYDDADSLILSVEVSDCIDDDMSGWSYIWVDKKNDNVLSQTSAYKKLLQNDQEDYKDDSLCVKVTNNLENYGSHYFYGKSDLKYRVNPIFNVVNDSVSIAGPANSTAKYNYEPYYDANKHEYHSMVGCGDISFVTHYSNNKTIYYNKADGSRKWSVKINGSTLSDDLYRLVDDTLVIDERVYNESGEYSMVISGWLKIKGKDEYKKFTFSQSPVIQIYEKPLITPDNFDCSTIYAVWDTTTVNTRIRRDKASTKEWAIQWFKTSDNGIVQNDFDNGSYNSAISIQNKKGHLRNSDTLRFISVCYAPDKKTEWYRDTVDRKILVWKHPEQITIHYHDTLDVKEEFKNRTGVESEINVNNRFKSGRRIQLGINTAVVDGNIKWSFEWYEYKNGSFYKIDEKTNGYCFNYPELSGSNNKSVIYKLTSYIDIPKIYNGKVVEVLGGRVNLEHTFKTIIWPAITITDKTNYYYNSRTEEDSLLVVQSPNNIPKPVLSTNITWFDGMPFEKPVYKWWRNNSETLSWTDDYGTNNTGMYPVDELHTIKCEVLGEDGLDWCGESIERTVRIYPEIHVDSYVKELLDASDQESYNALIVGDSINLTTDHNYSFGTWTYSDKLTLTKTGYNEFILASDTHYDKDWHYVLNEDWTKGVYADLVTTSVDLSRHVECVTDEDFKLDIDEPEYEREIRIWPYDSISTPTVFMNGENITIIHQGQEKDLHLEANHEYKNNDNRDYWKYRWYNEDEEYISQSTICIPHNSTLTASKFFKYKVKAVYQPKGASPREFSTDFYWKEYPAPAKIEIEQDRDTYLIREGDSFLYKLKDVIKSGNPDGWEFEWDDNITKTVIAGAEGLSRTITADLNYSGEVMYRRTSQYKVVCRNYSPGSRSELWCKTTVTFKTVTIHRRPKQPESYVMKGDGSSNIYIASAPDVDIPSESNDATSRYYSDKKYKFVFGDDNRDTTITARFHIYDSSPANPWVKTLWEYDDGYYCYSDPVYLSKSRSNTRSGIGEYSIDFPHFTAEFEEPATVSVSIFDSYGALIKTIVFDKKCSYDEDVDIAGLSEGVYVVLFDINGVKKSVKVVIR